MVAKFTQAPNANVHKRLLRNALFHVEVKLDHRVGVEIRCGCNNPAEFLTLLVLYMVAPQAHDLDQRVDLPAPVWGVAVNDHAKATAKILLE